MIQITSVTQNKGMHKNNRALTDFTQRRIVTRINPSNNHA